MFYGVIVPQDKDTPIASFSVSIRRRLRTFSLRARDRAGSDVLGAVGNSSESGWRLPLPRAEASWSLVYGIFGDEDVSEPGLGVDAVEACGHGTPCDAQAQTGKIAKTFRDQRSGW